jgi:Domain of unknown function (DUF4440)
MPAAVGSMLADSITSIGSDGTMRNKAEMLAAMKDPKYESAVEEDIKVSVYGDAVATTSISPCWSVASTRTPSFRRSKNTSAEPLLVRRPLGTIKQNPVASPLNRDS